MVNGGLSYFSFCNYSCSDRQLFASLSKCFVCNIFSETTHFKKDLSFSHRSCIDIDFSLSSTHRHFKTFLGERNIWEDSNPYFSEFSDGSYDNLSGSFYLLIGKVVTCDSLKTEITKRYDISCAAFPFQGFDDRFSEFPFLRS